MWKVFGTLSFIGALGLMCGATDLSAAEHAPLFPNFCEFDNDYRWFEPLYCECPDETERNEGLFFSYERVNWNVMSAPRSDLGDPNLPNGLQINSSELVDGIPGVVPGISNAIDVAQPDSEFGWGNRYSLGYVWDNAGWNVDVVGNLNAVDSKTYGVDNPASTQPFTGSVAVLFAVEDLNLLTGFPVDPAIINPTADTVVFVPSFDTLTVDHRTRIDGVEVMRLLRRNDFFVRDSTVDFLYGLRFLRVDNEMRVAGLGGFLADSNWASEVENKMIGPQVGLRWAKRKGRWSLRSEGRFMAALNVRDASLEGTMASLAQPGQANNSVFLNPTSFAQYDSDLEFSPVAEARLEAIFHFTKKVSFKVGYTATYASNIGYGSNMVGYTLPELSLRALDDLDTQHFFSNGVNFGFEINR